MGCLYSVFDVKKQGKPIWEARTRNWKLRGGENRLSGLLEGIPIASLGKARRQGGLSISFVQVRFSCLCSNLCISGLEYRYQNGGIGTDSSLEFVYRCSPIGTGTISLRYRYLYRGIGTVRQSMVRLRGGGRRGGRRGGRAPVHLDEIGMGPINEEPLPPPPPVGGEANKGGAAPQGGVGHQAGAGPQAGQGPAVGDMSPLIQAITGAFQTAMAGVQGVAQPQGGGNGLPLERLRHLGGVELRGLPPGKSEAWLENTIRILGQMECTDTRKLGCVVSLLQGDAYSWWTTVTSSMDEGEITWEFFQSAFRKKYLGTRYGDEKKREFMALVQGNMSVTDYEIQFVRLSQYAPELVPTERDRCDRFRYGLVKEVKTYMLAYDYTDFDVLVARAKDIEQSLGLPALASGSSSGKRPASWDRDSAKRHKDRRFQPEHRRGGGNPGRGHQGQGGFQQAPVCARCGRHHMGECWGNENSC
ncbi:hypothetical protein V6N13_148265 [Hibiscus sabdariffa]